MQLPSTRRHDVDWLRTLALGVLILYHLGMYYVADWNWHIKSDVTSVWLQNLMVMTNPWRMALLFFVSGMTLALIIKRYRKRELMRLRLLRLGVPLLVGMVIIVPPQLYYELVASNAFDGNYWQFYQHYLNLDTTLAPHKQSAIGLLTWNHLWYLAYLLTYTGVFLLIAPILQSITSSRLFIAIPAWCWALMVIAVLVINFFLLREKFATTHDLINDWYNHVKYFSVLVFGYFLVNREDVWRLIIRHAHVLLAIALCTYALYVLDRTGAFPDMAAQYQSSFSVRLLYTVLSAVNIWAWLLAMVGLAGRFLNRPSPALDAANEAVLPIYILHQTLIIIFAAWLVPVSLWTPLEAFVILSLTCATSVGMYLAIRRSTALRFLFGMKTAPAPEQIQASRPGNAI